MTHVDVEKIAFPTFSAEQFEMARRIGDRVTYDPDEPLIDQGQKDYPFFLIESGRVRIAEKRADDEFVIATHGPGGFTGDVDMLTGRAAVISAIADEPVQAIRMCAVRLRRLLNAVPEISETLLEAFQLRRKLLEASDFIGVRVVGDANSRETNRLREFFYKNHVPHTFYESNSDAGQAQLDCLQATALELPVVHCNGHTVGNPSLPKLAECIGISRDVDQQLFDLVVVGSGPAGLSASVYAASEGIKTLVIDSVGPGGQAGSSSRIENFIGFPSGLSGSELANRGYLQALKFGAQFIAPITVKSIESTVEGEHHLQLCTGQTARAKTILIATGVTYRQLEIPGLSKFEGAGVFYSATSVEARVCEDSAAVVVGGGNSAGQAAMFLANTAKQVKLLIRGNDLGKSMSDYLCDRVLNHPKIEVLTHTELSAVSGSNRVDSIEMINNQTGETSSLDCGAVFLFVGAKPHTDWLPEQIQLDGKGFVLTGSAISADQWPLDRAPCELETSVPGILAAGDVRSGSTKRCGFAVGDGSLAVACIHRYLSDLV